MKEPADIDRRYKDLFDLAADAILTGDPEGNIIGANRSATELSGYPHDELIDRDISFLFSAEEHKRVPLRYDLLKAGKVVQNKRLLTRKDGSTVPISMNSKMMPDGTYHTFIRDITQQKILEEKLRETNRELETFVYTVSHDLRTPLSSIIGFTDFLKEHGKETLDKQTLDILARIEQAGDGMLASMEALLTLAKAGTLPRPVKPVAINQIVENAINELDLRIAAVGMTVKAAELPGLHVPETFLGQIFSNLIGNAVHYASGNSGSIEIGGERTETRVKFFVRDRGPGIPEKDRDRIFEVFYRGAAEGKTKGTGIGLTIVQKIARTYGGKAWLEETPGGGCTFWVEMEDLPPT